MNTRLTRRPFTENPVTTITLLIKRDDGKEAKIVARASYTICMTGFYPCVDVFRRDSSSEPWRLCSDRPHPEWKTMSVDDYKAFGRPEMLQVVSTAEILRATQWLGRDASELPDNISVAA